MISKLALLPMMVFFVFQGTLIAAYVLGLIQSTVKSFVPVISETVAIPPGSCIFSQMINIGVVLLASTIYIRYRHTIDVSNHNTVFGLERLNLVSLSFGLISALGASIVANFQISNFRVVHEIGRMLYVTCGLVYFGTQTALTYYLVPLFGSRLVAHMRFTLVSFASLLFVIMVVCNMYARILYGGHDLHMVGTISEWLILLLFSVFMLSFVKEFSKIRYSELTLLSDNDHDAYVESQSSRSDEECQTVPYLQSCVSEQHIRMFHRIDYYNKTEVK